MYFEYYIMGIILLPALILAIIAQNKVTSTFNTYSKVLSASGKTGAEVARIILDSAGLTNVQITRVRGHLTDHYDPKKKIIALSSAVYDSTSVAAVGIATHEVGHAIQYKQNYAPVKLRSALVPVTNFASNLLWPLVIVGLLFNFGASSSALGMVFVWSGIVLFGLAALLNIVTLPVEYNASNRAVKVLYRSQILTEKETEGAKKVLNAAALTYVAAMLVAVLNLLRFLLVVLDNR